MSDCGGIDDLLAAAREGNKEAENQLFSQLRARILGLVQQRIWNANKDASENRRDAEDLSHDICITILKKYRTADFGAGFISWVFQISRHKIGEYYRKTKTKPWMETTDVEDENLAVPHSPYAPEQLAFAGELDRMICYALKKLGSRCQAIISALLEGNIKAYIAEARRTIPLNTIYSYIHRCRQRFQELLRAEGFDR